MRAREYYRLAHHKWFALSAITQTTTRFSSVCVCIYGVWWLLPTAHTHSTKAAGAHPHRHEKFLFWMDGWISRSAFSLFLFCSLFFWWYDEPKFVWDWTLLYPSSIGYYYTFILSLFSSLLSAGGMSPSRIIHIHELTYKCRSLYEKKDLLVYTHTHNSFYTAHII